MFRCHVCGKTESRQELVSENFDIEGKPVRVANSGDGLPPLRRTDVQPRHHRASSARGMEKLNQSSRFRWTCSPISNSFWFLKSLTQFRSKLAKAELLVAHSI